MSLRRLPLVPLIAALVGLGSPAALAEEGPWSEVWSMPLKGEDRVFVDYGETSYLVISPADLEDPAFLAGKDVALQAKFVNVGSAGPVFYHLDGLRIEGGGEAWATATDGDNFHLVGKIARGDGGLVLTLGHVLPAPSDGSVIADKLAAIAADDFEARLEIAQWAREEADRQGNKSFWIDASRQIVVQTSQAAAADAGTRGDYDLLLRAMEWAVQEIGDRDLAAELGSAAWVRDKNSAGAERVAERMRGLGYVFYADKTTQAWMSQAEALRREYDGRLALIHWRDADGFYRLGRWADKHADVLPRARELAHQAYQKGLQADETHNGIRRELGLEPVAGGDGRPFQRDYVHSSGVAVRAPDGWDRNAKPIENGADATWYDPRSDTSYISARVVIAESPTSFEAVWNDQMADIQALLGYKPGERSDLPHKEGTGRRCTYMHLVGDELRPAQMAIIYDSSKQRGVVLRASFAEGDLQNAAAAMDQMIERLLIPRAAPPKTDGQTGGAGEPTAAQQGQRPQEPATAGQPQGTTMAASPTVPMPAVPQPPPGTPVPAPRGGR